MGGKVEFRDRPTTSFAVSRVGVVVMCIYCLFVSLEGIISCIVSWLSIDLLRVTFSKKLCCAQSETDWSESMNDALHDQYANKTTISEIVKKVVK